MVILLLKSDTNGVFVCIQSLFLAIENSIGKKFTSITYQLDHDELVEPSDKTHLNYGVSVGVVESNVDVVVVNKAVDNDTVVHNRVVVVALLVSPMMMTEHP